MIATVFIPFLTAKRRPNYLNKKEYSHLDIDKLETNHFIQMSSIGSSASSMYKEFLQYAGFIASGLKNKYSIFSIPYQIPLKSGVISRSTIEKMVRESTTSIEGFKSEMEVIPLGEGESAMFSYEDMNKNRRLKNAIYPITDDEFIEYKGNIRKSQSYTPKEPTEVRVLTVDLALMGTKFDDNSICHLLRGHQSGDEYITDLPYTRRQNIKISNRSIISRSKLWI